MRHGKTIAVVIPALDEEQAIGRVIADVPAWADDIVVVDNGSHDGTAHAAEAAGARVVAELERGYGAACQAGIKALADPDIIVFLDGDYSDRPQEMDALVDPIAVGGFDLVVGSRVRGERGPGALTPQQRFGNWLACRFIHRYWGAACSDLGPFRAIRAGALRDLAMQDRAYGWTVEMQLKAVEAGLRYPGGAGELSRPHRRLKNLRHAARLAARRRDDPRCDCPLRLARTPLGLGALTRQAWCARAAGAPTAAPISNRRGARTRVGPSPSTSARRSPCQAKMPPARSSTATAPRALRPGATRSASFELLTPTEQ